MITDRHIQAAIKAAHSRRLSDGEGKGRGRLVLHIRPTNGGATAEWYVQQITKGKRRLKKLGTYPTLSLSEARRKFEEDYAAIIAEQKNIQTAKMRKSGTLEFLFASYVEFLKTNRKQHRPAERILMHALDSIGAHRKANEVTTEEIIDFLSPIYQRGKKRYADNCRGVVRSAFSWAIKSQNDYRRVNAERLFDLKFNPAESIPVEPKSKGKRWLEASELRALISWIDTYQPFVNKKSYTPTNLAALKLVAIMGQRVSEITTLRAGQYNKLRNCLAWNDTKTGTAHVVPLPRQARAILDSLTPNEYGWYFPSSSDPKRPTWFGRLTQMTKDYTDRYDVPHFSPRDLRRTFKTLGGFAGISKTDRDRLQNHAQGDVSSKHYDMYDYIEEKSAAMLKWETYLEENVFNEPQNKVINIAV